MAHTLHLTLSTGAASRLTALCKQFGMFKKGQALSWVIVETAAPDVPKRAIERRESTVEVEISDQAHAILCDVVAVTKSSESRVVEAYLARKY